MDKDELKKLLATPLDPDLDYYDATKSIEALADYIRGLHKLIHFLADSLALQAKSILELRKENVEIKADLLQAGIASTTGSSELIGFDEPSIVMPQKRPS